MSSAEENAVMGGASLADKILEQKRKNREALAYLLQEVLQAGGQKVALTARMADTESYLISAPLNWVANEMSFARDLPLFKKMEDEEGNLQIDERTIHEIVQRPLDWTRQLPLAIYIVGRDWHKFPVITAVLTQPWVDDPKAEEWGEGEDGKPRAKRDSTQFDPLDPDGRLGLLSLRGTTLYALDGQHRLIGLEGVAELLKKGRIQARNRKGDVKPGEAFTLEELAEEYQFQTDGLQKLNSELIGIEVIPAVKEGETRDEARRRVRSIFTHVNKSAVKLNAGQIAQLDEDNGFAILGRWAAVDHPLLKMTPARKSRPRVNWQNATISAKSTVFTTLQTLTEMAEEYLKERKEYQGWVSSGDMRGLIPVRPSDDELEKGLERFSEFLTAFGSLPSISELERGKTTQEFRNFGDAEVNDPAGQAHLLFRPIGQIALAGAVGALVNGGRDLDELFELLKAYEEEGKFSIDKVANPWWGVVYDPSGKKIARGGHEGPGQILLYLLGGLNGPGHKDARDALLDRLIRGRTLDEGGMVRNYDGQDISPEQFRLPAVVSQ